MKEGRTHPFAFNGEAGSRSFYYNTISGRDACGGPKPAGRPSKQNVPYQCETLDCSLRSPSWERSRLIFESLRFCHLHAVRGVRNCRPYRSDKAMLNASHGEN